MIHHIKNIFDKYGISTDFIKFLLVGGLNTGFGYAVFAFFIFLNFNYEWAVLIATILGILFNFKSTGIIVFKNRNNGLITKFLAIYAILYFITIVVLKGFIFLNFTNMYVNYAVLVLPNALLSYFLMKKFVFSVTDTTK